MSDAKDSSKSKLKELAALAAPIAQNSHLRSINLRKLEVEMLSEPPESEALDAEIESEHAVEFALSTTEERPRLTVRVHFQVKVRAQEGKADLFALSAIFALEYVLNKGMPDAVEPGISAFAMSNSMVHVWPYYRELVQSITWRMGIPPFPMPLFRIGASEPGEKKELLAAKK